MAKSDATSPEGATPEKKEGKAGRKKKTFKKRGEKRVVHHGLAHIGASFNNTIVTITDVSGNVCTGNQRLVNVATFIDGCRLADPGSADMAPWVERIPSEATDG